MLGAPENAGWFTGNALPPDAAPIAQAYAGHQYGHFVILGPGDWVEVPRGVHHTAAVIGEEPVVSLDGVRVERSGAG